MIAALLILVPIVAVVVWAFFHFVPAHADRKALRRFNVITLTLALALAGAWCVRVYIVVSPTVDSAWWSVLSALGALILIAVVLGFGAICRNFLVFRRRAEGASQ